mmetsp:Transcript_62341/g.190538  ORF Transcript_62341/g.190538 Transcript_62341/m.190538 type:complete len:219 (+) Transcript_62341:1872-2528(+)
MAIVHVTRQHWHHRRQWLKHVRVRGDVERSNACCSRELHLVDADAVLGVHIEHQLREHRALGPRHRDLGRAHGVVEPRGNEVKGVPVDVGCNSKQLGVPRRCEVQHQRRVGVDGVAWGDGLKRHVKPALTQRQGRALGDRCVHQLGDDIVAGDHPRGPPDSAWLDLAELEEVENRGVGRVLDLHHEPDDVALGDRLLLEEPPHHVGAALGLRAPHGAL